MSEIEEYRSQIRAIVEQLELTEDETERAELIQVKQDLEELVGLLLESGEEEVKQEEDEDSKPGTSNSNDDTNDGSDYEDAQDYDELVGDRCNAPYLRAQLPLSHHAAIILQVDPPGKGSQFPVVRVLYSHPLIASMKPCQHFLNGTCRFEENCRFSHGEAVSLDQLEPYKEPDFSKFGDDSLVLCAVENGLWELGRVTARDEDELAVKLNKSGKEISTNLEKIVPIEEDEIRDQKGGEDFPSSSYPTDFSDIDRSNEWSELKGTTSGRIAVGELGNWSGGGFGLKLMQKMGYKLGEGLGKRSDGIVHAIQAEVLPKNKSLDEVMTRKRKMIVDGKEEKKKRVKKALESTKSNQIEHDIFSFINRKLNSEKDVKKAEQEKAKQEKQEINSSSNKQVFFFFFIITKDCESLGIKRITLEKELSDLKAKQARLKQGVERNKNDKNTVANIQKSLEEVQKEASFEFR
ncbi:hypothetical protein WR25_06267 [Diploscapter pachys]|uniref:Zinc finger CCCH-type with G patch domain-containing protein n=1 Tax=Diploscapter pachys TaxID=2018661 RepID=A0A2A2LXC1_9BILA|nr:hypothetical protein WR25_06267 [Diploscapter pachys]